MKKLLPLLICILGVCGTKAQGYHITVKSNNRSGIAFLGYHQGKSIFVTDSAAVPANGTVVFKGAKKLPGGIYVIVFPGKLLSMDFLIDREQVISITADTAHLEKAVITGSPANTLFREYSNFVNIKGTQLETERKAYSASRTAADSATHEANYRRYNRELNDYRDNIVRTRPTSMMAVLLSAMKDPPYPSKTPVTHTDSLNNYNFYKDHYWDNINFTEDRIIRTPFFLPKLERYYREVMSQSSDSLIRDIDYRLLLARTSPEMYKFLLNWFTDEYYNPKYMGQDAIFVHLFQQYHSLGVSTWLSDKQHETITKKAYMLMSNLIGEQAADLKFTDTAGKPTPLYDVKADYTVVVFWDPTCGHCKEEIPKIDSMYRASWQQKNVKIYAVLSETEKLKPEWLAYINEHHIGDWINVYQSNAAAAQEEKDQQPSYRQLYNIVLTPTLYLVDKDKHIIAKNLTRYQINDLLELKIKQGQH